ncbi:MAG: class I SAM-dependent methyltransferase [Magnetococcales bacterium]|nr:class I SAM-dependent methyltransferase [Magnetococcales bacterium]
MDEPLRLDPDPDELNGDAELTIEEKRRYARRCRQGLFFKVPAHLPTASLFVHHDRPLFRQLLKREPGASPGRHYTNLALHQLVMRYCPGQAEILDVGCGAGGFVQRVEACGIAGRYLGVDVLERSNWQWLEQRPGPAVHARFLVQPAERMTFDQQFDFVICSHSLEHQRFPSESLVRIHAALKPGAYGVLFVPAPWAYLLYGQHGWRYFQPAHLETLCRQAGLQIETFYPIGGLFSFLVHWVCIAWLESGVAYQVLTGQYLHWRIQRILDGLRFRSLRKNRYSVACYAFLNRLLMPLDVLVSRPSHLYALVVRRPEASADVYGSSR